LLSLILSFSFPIEIVFDFIYNDGETKASVNYKGDVEVDSEIKNIAINSELNLLLEGIEITVMDFNIGIEKLFF